MPITNKLTLRELLENVVHKTKFNSNDNLFRNMEQWKEEESSDEDKLNKKNKPWY